MLAEAIQVTVDQGGAGRGHESECPDGSPAAAFRDFGKVLRQARERGESVEDVARPDPRFEHWRWFLRHSAPIQFLVVLLLMGASGIRTALKAQEEEPSASHARRGLLIGSVSGGLLGGAALGTLAAAFCESTCENSFRDGFLLGFLGGGAVGGITGLVIGAGFPRASGKQEAEPPEGWSLHLAAGPRWTGRDLGRGLDLQLGAAILRPTTRSIWWGLEAAYLGQGSWTNRYTIQPPSGQPIVITQKRRRTLLGISVMATRALQPVSSSSPYLLASVGAYPLMENVRETRSPEASDDLVRPALNGDSSELFPGIGLGGGALWQAGDRWKLGVDSRLHLIFGAANDAIQPLFSLVLSGVMKRGG